MHVREGLRGADGFTAGDCMFCDGHVNVGAFWLGADSVYVCRSCVGQGQLGKLIGDAAHDCHDVAHFLDATALQAWRALALALAKER